MSSGSPAVLSTSPIGNATFAVCVQAAYSVGSGDCSKSTSLTSSTTPTTIAMAVPRWIRRPIGSPPGQNRSANDRLTMATAGVDSESRAAKALPLEHADAHRLEVAGADAPELHGVAGAVRRALVLDVDERLSTKTPA